MFRTGRTPHFVVAAALIAACASRAGADQSILGRKLDFRSNGTPEGTRLRVTASEHPTPNTLVGDPQANGASLTLLTNGATSGSQTFVLPGSGWRRFPSKLTRPLISWNYGDSRGVNSPVRQLKLHATGTFSITLNLDGRKVGGVSVVPPNPATFAAIMVTISGATGDRYCVGFGGAAGGRFKSNSSSALFIDKIKTEIACPTTDPVCGDEVIQSPAEVCDVGNDAACPGLCGASLPCLCPFCGDGVINDGESCDGAAALGSCTEGCSSRCECTTCGNDVVEFPGEECEQSDVSDCPNGICMPPGDPNQCHCAYCGDDSVNQSSEQCDGSDDSACPGTCVTDSCTCPVCGNGEIEPGEACDPGGPGGNPPPADWTCEIGCMPTCQCMPTP